MSSYKEGQINQLANALEAAGFTPEDITNLGQGDLISIRSVLRGQAKIVSVEVETRKEEVIGTIIRVDRLIRPVYPDWVQMVMHPELENTGPAEYDIGMVEQWLHPMQKQGKIVTGNKIYDHLKDNNLLNGCVGLADLQAIQAKGIDFFRKYFSGKWIYGWKSVVRRRDGHLDVPCLIGDGGKVVLYWSWLGRGWFSDEPALRLANQP